MKHFYLLLALLTFSTITYSQECNCLDIYNWVKTTFEQNDVGFEYAISRHTETEVLEHNAKFVEKTKNITNNRACMYAINDWLNFYRKCHLALKLIKYEKPTTKDSLSNKQSKIWPIYEFDRTEFESYLSELENPGIEGIWLIENRKLGIMKDGDAYIGFVLESKATNKPLWIRNP